VRLLLLGSLLPDIIDKPIGRVFFRETFDSGRIFCHTLLFLILLSLIGLYIYRRRHKAWLLVISFGVFVHLILDGMWGDPDTLLWPLYGWTFPKQDISPYWESYFSNAAVLAIEIVGAAILIWLAVYLVHRKGVKVFIKRGRIPL